MARPKGSKNKRPAATGKLSVRISQELLEEIDRFSHNSGTKRSDTVITAIRSFLQVQ